MTDPAHRLPAEPDTDPVAAATAAELALLQPGLRRDPARAAALLHPEFHETGASGRRYDRPAILALLAAEDRPEGGAATVTDLHGVRLAEDLVHLVYDTFDGERHVHRSSLWRRTPEGWRLYHHQGTPYRPDAD
ncbi:DUF4440 domain-containing protein [Streptomyces sp. NPDC058045]|uniref:nuclear transport factor 2 family protein n=1 Tax=Streptomyces sp. NPDC058045 TaxID=3346311 RepID=UPI0036E97F8A